MHEYSIDTHSNASAKSKNENAKEDLYKQTEPNQFRPKKTCMLFMAINGQNTIIEHTKIHSIHKCGLNDINLEQNNRLCLKKSNNTDAPKLVNSFQKH